MNTPDDFEDTDDLEPKSRAEQKREAEAAQAMGKLLVELSAEQITEMADKLDFADKLRHALLECRTIKSHEARRRQLQFIGKLMRGVELEPVQNMLAAFKRSGVAQTAQFHLIEDWRERLLSQGEPALNELLQNFPALDGKHVRKLIAAAKHEAANKQSPKSARLLFRYLRDNLSESAG